MLLPVLFFLVGITSASVLGPVSPVGDLQPLLARHQENITTLSLPRYGLAAAAAGGYLLFSGGDTDDGGNGVKAVDRVDIYDGSSNTWRTSKLSQARGYLAGASWGSKTFFAGGTYGLPNNSTALTDVVDIYDVATHAWTIARLSQRRAYVVGAAAGGKVFFGGGEQETGTRDSVTVSDRVDIYDLSTNSWTTANLSQPRTLLAAASLGGKVFFAGGSNATSTVPSKFRWPSDVVDIYDTATNTWTTARLSIPRHKLVGAAAGNKVLFAGGMQSDRVDIYDLSTNKWTTASLSQGRDNMAATTVGSKILFAGGDPAGVAGGWSDRVDIYDTANDTWTTARLSYARFLAAGAAFRSSKAFIAGGVGHDGITNLVDIFRFEEQQPSPALSPTFYPSPSPSPSSVSPSPSPSSVSPSPSPSVGSSRSPSPSPSTPNSEETIPVWAIVVGAVGGVAILLLAIGLVVVVLVLVFRRRPQGYAQINQ